MVGDALTNSGKNALGEDSLGDFLGDSYGEVVSVRCGRG